EWATMKGRIGWLVKTRFGGNRSKMAKAIGFSHTIIANVTRDDDPKTPGRRLLEAITSRLGVDPVWLQTGAGQPFPREVEAGTGGAAPRVPPPGPPGPPLDHQALISGDWAELPEVVASPTTYWLALMSSQPIVQQQSSGFRPGDHLLMETDPAKFPRETHFHD